MCQHVQRLLPKTNHTAANKEFIRCSYTISHQAQHQDDNASALRLLDYTSPDLDREAWFYPKLSYIERLMV